MSISFDFYSEDFITFHVRFAFKLNFKFQIRYLVLYHKFYRVLIILALEIISRVSNASLCCKLCDNISDITALNTFETASCFIMLRKFTHVLGL